MDSAAVPAGRPAAASLPAVTGAEVGVSAALLAVVAAAEVTFLAAGLLAGVVASVAAIAILIGVAMLNRGAVLRAAAVALAVLPLLRVLSIVVPSLPVPVWVWYAEMGVPLLVGTLLAASVAGLGPSDLGLTRRVPLVTLLAPGAGLILGLAAFLVTQPASVLSDRSASTFVLASVAVIVGGAVAEELLFRGLLQHVADRVVPGSGVLVSAALCTLLYVATVNVRYIILMAELSVLLGLVTRRYGSLTPAIVCHAVLLWSQLVLWPVLLR